VGEAVGETVGRFTGEGSEGTASDEGAVVISVGNGAEVGESGPETGDEVGASGEPGIKMGGGR